MKPPYTAFGGMVTACLLKDQFSAYENRKYCATLPQKSKKATFRL